MAKMNKPSVSKAIKDELTFLHGARCSNVSLGSLGRQTIDGLLLKNSLFEGTGCSTDDEKRAYIMKEILAHQDEILVGKDSYGKPTRLYGDNLTAEQLEAAMSADTSVVLSEDLRTGADSETFRSKYPARYEHDRQQSDAANAKAVEAAKENIEQGKAVEQAGQRTYLSKKEAEKLAKTTELSVAKAADDAKTGIAAAPGEGGRKGKGDKNGKKLPAKAADKKPEAKPKADGGKPKADAEADKKKAEEEAAAAEKKKQEEAAAAEKKKQEEEKAAADKKKEGAKPKPEEEAPADEEDEADDTGSDADDEDEADDSGSDSDEDESDGDGSEEDEEEAGSTGNGGGQSGNGAQNDGGAAERQAVQQAKLNQLKTMLDMGLITKEVYDSGCMTILVHNLIGETNRSVKELSDIASYMSKSKDGTIRTMWSARAFRKERDRHAKIAAESLRAFNDMEEMLLGHSKNAFSKDGAAPGGPGGNGGRSGIFSGITSKFGRKADGTVPGGEDAPPENGHRGAGGTIRKATGAVVTVGSAVAVNVFKNVHPIMWVKNVYNGISDDLKKARDDNKDPANARTPEDVKKQAQDMISDPESKTACKGAKDMAMANGGMAYDVLKDSPEGRESMIRDLLSNEEGRAIAAEMLSNNPGLQEQMMQTMAAMSESMDKLRESIEKNGAKPARKSSGRNRKAGASKTDEAAAPSAEGEKTIKTDGTAAPGTDGEKKTKAGEAAPAKAEGETPPSAEAEKKTAKTEEAAPAKAEGETPPKTGTSPEDTLSDQSQATAEGQAKANKTVDQTKYKAMQAMLAGDGKTGDPDKETDQELGG